MDTSFIKLSHCTENGGSSDMNQSLSICTQRLQYQQVQLATQ